MGNPIHHFVLCAGAALSLCAAFRAADGPPDTPQERAGRNPFSILAQDRAPQLRAPAENPELLLETIVLKFFDAKSLKDVLDRMVSSHGTVAINEKNNSIIVCDTAENLRKILAEVKKADQSPRQVVVEVVILDVQLRDDTEIGVNGDLLSTDRYDVVYRRNPTSVRLSAVPPTPETTGSAIAYDILGMGGDFSVVSGTVRHVLHVIQQKRNVEILASPRALVVSGQSATIKAVEEIPYEEIIDTAQEGSATLTSTEFKEVGVNLQVSATVTDGNNIFLIVDTEQNVRTGASERGGPGRRYPAGEHVAAAAGRPDRDHRGAAAPGEGGGDLSDSPAGGPAPDRLAFPEHDYGEDPLGAGRALVAASPRRRSGCANVAAAADRIRTLSLLPAQPGAVQDAGMAEETGSKPGR